MAQLAILLVLGSAVLHAGWNLLAHAQRAHPFFFAHMCLWIVVLGIMPAAAGVWYAQLLPAGTWGHAALSGICLSVYFLGLTNGYRRGDFTMVYPLARALPILLLAGFDVARGHTIELTGYGGIAMVMGGCLFLAANGTRAARAARAGTANGGGSALPWVIIIALGTVGYTSIDKLAMERVAGGHWLLAVQYGCLQFAFAWPGLWLALRRMYGRPGDAAAPARSIHRIAAVVAAGNFAAYLLVLLAYQLVDQASYIVAMRQFSIVIGAALGAWLLREPAPAQRLIAATLITAGVALIVGTLAR